MKTQSNDELRLDIVMFLIASQIAKERTEKITTTTLYKSKFKQWINLALEELFKQEKFFNEIWLKDEENMVNIYRELGDIVQILASSKPSTVIKLTHIVKDLVSNPDFEKLPTHIRPLDDDIVNVDLNDRELTIRITNQKRFRALQNESNFENIIRKVTFDRLKSRENIVVLSTTNLDETAVTDGDNVWVIEDLKHKYSFINILAAKDKVTLKVSRTLKLR